MGNITFAVKTRPKVWFFCLAKQTDFVEYDILDEQKVIAHNLKIIKEQIIDDLNDVMSDLPKKDTANSSKSSGL